MRSESVAKWRVIVGEPKEFELGRWRRYRGTRITGNERESLEEVLVRAIGIHHSTMLACGRSMSRVTHMLCFDSNWHVITSLPINQLLQKK